MPKAILFFLIPVFITMLSVFAITSSKEAETVKLPAAYGPGTGYQEVPEQWTVTASSHYKWSHGTSPGWLWAVGILCFAAAGAYIYYIDKEVKGSTWVVIAFFWLAGLAAIFGEHVGKYYKSGTFSKTVSKEVYEANKGNLDAIFIP